MTTNVIQLSRPQYELVTTPFPYPAFVGGFGSGKTEALITKAIIAKANYPECNIAYYLPTFDLVSMIAFPRFEEKLEAMQAINPLVSFKIIKSPRPLIKIENGGDIIFRTMDNPNRIVGYEVADSFVDELDVLKEKLAREAWIKIVARNRQKKKDGAQNTISVGTTPEGFKFVYQMWKRKPKPGYHLIKASTYSNRRNLPANYIEDLKALYPSNLIAAYLDGEFVNLTEGSVYPRFDRVLNGSTETIGTMMRSGVEVGEDLHIGMDFNVTKMAAVIFVRREAWPHAVAEITKIFDTPAMIKAIKARYPNHRVYVYPDATGGSRKPNDASVSDISLLENANFIVLHDSVNPAVKDRVLSLNVLIENGDGDRRLKVNVDECPDFAEGLEKQTYDHNGEPSKSSGLDHALDAGGYFIAYCFPVRGKGMQRVQTSGH